MDEIHNYLSNNVFFQLGLLIALYVAALGAVSTLDLWIQSWRRRSGGEG